MQDKPVKRRRGVKKGEPQQTALLYVQLISMQSFVGKVPDNSPLLNGMPTKVGDDEYIELVDPLFMAPYNAPSVMSVSYAHLGLPFVHSPVRVLPIRLRMILFCAKVESELALRTYAKAFSAETNPFAAVVETSKAMLAEDAKKKEADADARKLAEQEALFHMEAPSKIPS